MTFKLELSAKLDPAAHCSQQTRGNAAASGGLGSHWQAAGPLWTSELHFHPLLVNIPPLHHLSLREEISVFTTDINVVNSSGLKPLV